MVTANLRAASLKQLCVRLATMIDEKGILILSGIKDDELDGLLALYTTMEFKRIWTANELGWVGIVLQKRS